MRQRNRPAWPFQRESYRTREPPGLSWGRNGLAEPFARSVLRQRHGFTLVVSDGSVIRASAEENQIFLGLARRRGKLWRGDRVRSESSPGPSSRRGHVLRRRYPRHRAAMASSYHKHRTICGGNFANNCATYGERSRPLARASAASQVWFGLATLKRAFGYGSRAVFLQSCAVTACELSFLALQTMADAEFPHGRRYYTKSGYFKVLDDQDIRRMVEALAAVPPLSARSSSPISAARRPRSGWGDGIWRSQLSVHCELAGKLG